MSYSIPHGNSIYASLIYLSDKFKYRTLLVDNVEVFFRGVLTFLTKLLGESFKLKMASISAESARQRRHINIFSKFLSIKNSIVERICNPQINVFTQ